MDSREQQNEILLPFLKDGRSCGDKLLGIVPTEHRQRHLEWLRDEDLYDEDHVDLLTFEQAYLRGGRFSVERMLEQIDTLLSGARADGHSGLRGFGEMQWALGREPQLLEYEARVNEVIARYDDPLVCVYDVKQFGAEVLKDVLATHPLVILGSRIYENEYFVPPRKYLAQRAARKRRRA